MKTYKVKWQSPSNIALVKYWGKRQKQIPENPSVSFTLSKSYTELSVELLLKTSFSSDIDLTFYFENKESEKFKEKILKFLKTQLNTFPWLSNFKIIIHSINTFPHSSGIASSASSMSALNLCLMRLDEQVNDEKYDCVDFLTKASELSRLASGSAGRSVFPYLASWGEIKERSGTSNHFATGISKNEIHPDFHEFCDSIIIVDAKEKSVSSRAGHALMENHPFRNERYALASKNLELLLTAMKTGDMTTFIEIVEAEALMLHALMMTSTPSYILLKPDSLKLIEAIREFRVSKNVPVCFTIDAGPNIHLLYPFKYKKIVLDWLERDFSNFTMIHDEVGNGPKELRE